MKKFRILLILLLLLTLIVGSASAAIEHYLKLEGIEGYSKDPNHLHWIELLDFSYGSTEDPPGKQGVLTETFTFTHLVDKASLSIQQAFKNGTVIPTCTFDLGSKGNISYRIKGTNARIKNIKVKSDPTGDDSFQVIEIVEMLVENPKHSFDPNSDLPGTGDTAPLLLWVLLAIVSVTTLFLLRKRKA